LTLYSWLWWSWFAQSIAVTAHRQEVGHWIGGRFDATKANHPRGVRWSESLDTRQAEGKASRRIIGESIQVGLLIAALIDFFVW